jgi:hypothetical protein
MLQSHVIDISGTFAGAAVRMSGTYRFVAVDPRVTDLNHSEWPSLDAVRHAVADRIIGDAGVAAAGSMAP